MSLVRTLAAAVTLNVSAALTNIDSAYSDVSCSDPPFIVTEWKNFTLPLPLSLRQGSFLHRSSLLKPLTMMTMS